MSVEWDQQIIIDILLRDLKLPANLKITVLNAVVTPCCKADCFHEIFARISIYNPKRILQQFSHIYCGRLTLCQGQTVSIIWVWKFIFYPNFVKSFKFLMKYGSQFDWCSLKLIWPWPCFCWSFVCLPNTEKNWHLLRCYSMEGLET